VYVKFWAVLARCGEQSRERINSSWFEPLIESWLSFNIHPIVIVCKRFWLNEVRKHIYNLLLGSDKVHRCLKCIKLISLDITQTGKIAFIVYTVGYIWARNVISRIVGVSCIYHWFYERPFISTI
jgi:hypothetical protein